VLSFGHAHPVRLFSLWLLPDKTEPTVMVSTSGKIKSGHEKAAKRITGPPTLVEDYLTLSTFILNFADS